MDPIQESTQRAHREAAFHDKTFASGGREAADKFYSIADTSWAYYRGKVLARAQGVRALEYGCGTRSCAFDLAAQGADVTAIDISQVAIDLARTQARDLNVRVDLAVMNAEELTFEPETFDRICGSGILHHLDLSRSCRQIHKVLRAGGAATFYEPLGHNPLINLYRSRTPTLRTQDEHPLLRSDLELIRSFFPKTTFRYFHLASLAAVPLRNTRLFRPVRWLTDQLDQLLLSSAMPSKYWAWVVVIHIPK